ncbi:hypothetical protein HUJ05_001719 [Dendroctonus ponderosae]|nr:hypothetical protein HUJ05_001719 [Dendroctonus ponderosae]
MLTNEGEMKDIEEKNKQIITAMKEAENKCKITESAKVNPPVNSEITSATGSIAPGISDFCSAKTCDSPNVTDEGSSQRPRRNESLGVAKEEKWSDSNKKLMEKRINLTDKHQNNVEEILKAIRRDVKLHKTEEITRVIEKNRGMKVFRKKLSEGKKQLNKIIDKKNGQTTTNKRDILLIVRSFYAELDKKTSTTEIGVGIPVIQNQGSEDIPEITQDEINNCLKNMKNNKSPADDKMSTENIKLGGSALLKIVSKLYNACLRNSITPDQWNKSIIILLHKKGDIAQIENHRPIILLSQIYKLFMRIVTKRLRAELDIHQHIEQAGFRKGYGTSEHLHPIKILIEKCIEYNKPVHVQTDNIENLGININGEKLSHLRFANDLILITNDFKEAQEMMSEMNLASREAGIKINIGKTKFMTNLVANENLTVNNLNIEQVYSYKYLGHEIRLGRDNQTCEIGGRTGLIWAAFGKLSYILRSDIPMCLKRRVFDQCILPVVTYGAETLTLTKNTANKIRVAHEAWEKWSNRCRHKNIDSKMELCGSASPNKRRQMDEKNN